MTLTWDLDLGFIWSSFNFCLGSCMDGSCKQICFSFFHPLLQISKKYQHHQYQSISSSFQFSMSTFFSCSSFSCLSLNSSNSSSCTSFTFPAPPNPPPAPPTTHHHQTDFSHLSFICASNVHLGLLSSENSYFCF